MRCRQRRIATAAAVSAAFLVLAGAADADAARKKVRVRHHADPMRVMRPAAAGQRAITALPATWCGVEQAADVSSPLSNAPQIKVIYARGLGAPNNFATYDDMIQADVNVIRQRLDTESAATGLAKSIRFDLGNVAPGGGCGGNLAKQYVDIQSVELPRTVADYNGTPATLFTKLKTDIPALAAAAAGARRDYLVYADGINKGAGIAGEATSALDDSHGYGNATNRGGLVAVIYGFGGAQFNGATESIRRSSFLHELSHTQGAVQDSAPHASRAGHCFDDNDIMCYNDGGPYFTGGGVLLGICPVGAPNDFTEAFDCNRDDYFNAAPAAGSYLATKWNAYDSVFLCVSTTCDTTIAPPTVALDAPAGAFRGNTLSLTANATGATIEHYEWDLDNDGIFERDTGATNTTSQQLTANGTKTVRVRATTADGTFGLDTKAITVSEPATPGPSFTIASGAPLANAPVTFDASATTDPSGVITNFKWDFDGNTTIDLDAGLSRTATTTFTTPGTRLVTLTVTFPLGFATRSAQVVVGGGTTTQQPTTVIAPKLAATLSKLAKLLQKGLRLTITCGAPCAATAKLTVSAKTAKKLGLKGKPGKRVKIGSLKKTLPAAGILKTQLLLTQAARRALAAVKSVAMSFTATVTQPGAAPLKVTRALLVKR